MIFSYVEETSYHIFKTSFFKCFQGEQMDVNNINLLKLIPDSRHYMTYDGSITQPGCQETVTWIIMNRPITVSKDQVRRVLLLSRSESNDLFENKYLNLWLIFWK